MQVLITGASSGIGRATCEKLLANGHQVVGIARDFDKFSCENQNFTQHCIDLAELDTLPARLKELTANYPDLNAVILNAGRGHFAELEQFSYQQIRTLTDLNFTSHAFVARAFVPQLKKVKAGHLIFTGSEAALKGAQKGTLYCAAKFALRGFAQALRAETARSGIRVTMINPGMVQSPFYDELDFQPGYDTDNFILPEDVAEVIEQALKARDGTVIDEINLSPQKKVVASKRNK
jgi:3-hydroxy acid dehydrogenase / malonic semialdehyde reductase